MPELIVDAELLDPGPPMPLRGMFHAIALMRYRVLAVVEGAYEHPELHVGHVGADLADAAFQPGARRRLYLTRAFPDGVNVLGVEQAGPGGAFFCERSEPL